MLTVLVFVGWFCLDLVLAIFIYAAMDDVPWMTLVLINIALIHAIYMSYIFHKKHKAKKENKHKLEIGEDIDKSTKPVDDELEETEPTEISEVKTFVTKSITYFSMNDVDKISKSSMTKGKKGIAFEEFCMKLLDKNGYTDVQATRATGDMGADIIAWKFKRKIAFQCKCYDEHNVGVDAVQEITASLNTYGAGQGVVITNSHFTKQARNLAEDCRVKLIDREGLQKLIDNANEVINQEHQYEQDLKRRKAEKLTK